MTLTRSVRTMVAVLAIAGGACSENGSTPEGSGGSPGSGGASQSGGSASGGTTSSGGSVAGGSGGSSSATGGASGGTTATGGRTTTGGTTSTGGSTSAAGGTTASGGVSAGGTTGSGGTTAGTGGTTAGTGGRTGTGGTGAPGGSTGTGGTGTGGTTGTTPSGKSAGCGKAPTLSSSQYNNGNPISITAAGKQRRYILSVPTNYDNTKPYKLVLAIHQLDGNDKQMYNQKYYQLQDKSNNTTIFAAPNGQKNGAGCTGTGDGDGGCGWPDSSGQDMALMDAVVAQVEENFCIDTDRIFATGWSYGASMSYKVGCQRPASSLGTATWGVRAIAIYNGAQLSGNCTPSKPVAFYGSHGTNDNVLGYDGGVGLAKNYASANGCTWANPTKASGSHVCTSMKNCKEGYPLDFCSFVGPHTPWPDNGSSMTASWQPAVVWTFLNQF